MRYTTLPFQKYNDETIRAPMHYTLGEAAKATGKSKPTIQRAIKSGKISAHRNDDGSYTIDPAELHRVFDALPRDRNDEGTMKQSVPPSDTGVFQAEIMGLKAQIDLLVSERDHLRRTLAEETEERRRLTALLTDQRVRAVEPAPQSPQEPSEGRLGRAWRILTGKA